MKKFTIFACWLAVLLLALSADLQIFCQTPFPDMTGDETVDKSDLLFLLRKWGHPGIADLDNNGFIGPNDARILRQGWHSQPPTPTPAPPAPTPNPAIKPIPSTIIATRTIGPGGGSILVPDTHPELGGSALYFPAGSFDSELTVYLASVSDDDLRGEAERDDFLGAIAIEISDFANGIPPFGTSLDADPLPWIVTLWLRENRPIGDQLIVRTFDAGTGNFREARLRNDSPIIAFAVEENKALFAIDQPGIYATLGTYSYTGEEREPAVQVAGPVERLTWDFNNNSEVREFFYPVYLDDRPLRGGRALNLPGWQRHAWKKVIKELLVQTNFTVIPRYKAVDELFANISRYEDVTGVIYALVDLAPGIHILWELGDLPVAFTSMKIVGENADAVRDTLRLLYAAALERRLVQQRAQALRNLVQGTWLETNGPFQDGFEDALYEIGYLWDENWDKATSAIEAGALLERSYNVGIHVGAPLVGRALLTRFMGLSPDSVCEISILFNALHAKIESNLAALEREALMSCLATLDQVAFQRIPFDGDYTSETLESLSEEIRAEILLRLYSARAYYRNYSLFLGAPVFSSEVLGPLLKILLKVEDPAAHDMAWELQDASLFYAGNRINQIEEGYALARGVEDNDQYFAAGTWRSVPAFGLEPRLAPAMAYDAARQRVVLFGGLSSSAGSGGPRTWEWNENDWSEIDDSGPPVRWGHGIASDIARGKIVLFGGQSVDLSAFFGDTWEWDGTGWTQVAVTGPAARWGHAMAYDEIRGKVVLFGGQPRDFSKFFADTWEWDGTEWTQVVVNGPTARTGPAMAYDAARGKIILFGGSQGWMRLGDIWEWDGTEWIEIDAAGPRARNSHAMTYDPIRGKIVLFGGLSSEIVAVPGGGNVIRETRLDDTWEWDGTHWQEVAIIGPRARWGHAMAYDATRGRVVLFGGMGAEPFGDTWEYVVE